MINVDLVGEFNPIYDAAKAEAIAKAEKRKGRKVTDDEEACIFFAIFATVKAIKARDKGDKQNVTK